MSSNEEELARQLFESRHDPEEWSDEESEIQVRPKGTEVVSFRLPSNELDAVASEALRAGESLSQFIRGALVLRIHGQPIGPAVEITTGHGTLIVHSRIVANSRSQNPSFIPDFPPQIAAINR